MDSAKALSQVVGENARAIRIEAESTLNVVARHARAVGLNWSTGKVGDLESGRVSPTLPTLFAVSLALSQATRSEVTIADLVRHDGYVRINSGFAILGARLEEAMRGNAPELRARDVLESSEFISGGGARKAIAQGLDEMKAWPKRLDNLNQYEIAEIDRASGLDEQRLAKALHISEARLSAESLALWGRSFATERDQRAGPDANPQKRGRVSRQLKADLRTRLNGDDQ